MKNEKNSQTAKKGRVIKIVKIAVNVLLWVFVAFAVAVTIMVLAANNDDDNIPSLGGKCMINILTPSMSPTIDQGDMIIARRVTGDEDKQSFEVGDIITFKFERKGASERELNTHRIIEVIKESGATYYVTKGDNNMVEDQTRVVYKDVVATWDEDNDIRLKNLGKFLDFLKTSTGFLVIIVIPLLLFFIYELIRFIIALKEVRNKGKKQITAADEEEIKRRAVEEYLRQQQSEKEKAEAKVEEVKTDVEEKVEEVKTDAEEKVEEAKTEIEDKVEEVKAEAEAKVEETASDIVDKAKDAVESEKTEN